MSTQTQKSLTITVTNHAGASNALFFRDMSLVGGYLQSAPSGEIWPPAEAPQFVFMPVYGDAAGPDGKLTFLIGDTDGQEMVVKLSWPDVNQPGATVVTAPIPGFTVKLENDNLNDPNTPSCTLDLWIEHA
jgi:hypothetical protein